MRDPRDIIIRPLVTEKATGQMNMRKYTFVVAEDANKIEIKDAIERIFKVNVTSVRTMRVPGKLKRVGRSAGMTPSWKKAIVTLREGQAIPLFEGV